MIECNDKHVYSYQVRAQKVALAITSLVSGISLSLSRPNKVNMDLDARKPVYLKYPKLFRSNNGLFLCVSIGEIT